MAEVQQASGPSNTNSYDAKDHSGLTPDEKILSEARERFRLCNDHASQIRAEALDDLKFFRGTQWNDLILRERTEDRRPALTINKLPVYVQQVVNDMRQNRPQLKVRAVDNLTDPKTADVINGICRHIMANNDVKAALDTALEYAVVCGQGFFRIRTDFCDSKSFDQEILVERIDNPLAVYFPISLCKAVDYSDAPYAFLRTSMSKEEFKRKYSDVAQDEILSWSGQGIGDTNWTTEDMVWLAEYFEVKEEYKTLYMLVDGTTTFDKPEDPAFILKERESCVKEVIWRLISEKSILDEKVFPGEYIPIIPVMGWEINIDGQKSFMSLIRHAKDPQRFYNYMKSAEAETIALAPKAPWLVAAGQIENFENDWKVANTKNLAYLEYNPMAANGQPVAPPQRIDPPQIPSAAVNAMREASDDIKATTGLFDASMGAAGNEKSGKAIMARQRQGDTATYHFIDNLSRAIRQMGRIIVNLIPEIYDTPRAVRILGEDMADEIALVNQIHHDDDMGEDRIYDLSVGKYDVTVDVGPSYESKRMETAENLTNIIQAVPTIGQLCSDILVRNMDFPGASELSDRLKRTIPPNLLEDPNEKPNKISDADIQAIIADMQALQQQLQLAGQEKQQMMSTIDHFQGLLKDKTEETQIKADTAVLRARAENHKADMAFKTEQMKQAGMMSQHAINSAIQINKAQDAIPLMQPESQF